MKCRNCSKDLPEEAKFCVFCGHRILKNCPGCGKTIDADHEVCESCSINVHLHEENLRLAEEGKKLEHRSDYKGAQAFYEKIKDPKTPGVSELVEQLSQKLRLIDDSYVMADKLIKAKKWKEARQWLIKMQRLEPSSDFAATGLKSLRAYSRRRARIAWVIVCAAIIVTVGAGFSARTNSVRYLATNGLRSLLDSEDLAIRNSAALVLGWQGDRTAAPTLRLLANSGDPRKSVYSSAALLEIDPSTAIPVLREIMREGDVASTLGAAYTLTELGDTTIVPELASYLDISNEDLRIGASVLLFDFGYSLGMSIVQEALTDTLGTSKLKGLYALYLLGDEKTLALHEENWAPTVKNLLWDRTAEVRLLAAFLLNEFAGTLSSQDSIAIEHILWEEFAHKDEAIAETEEIQDISAFHVAKRIINRRGDEDISEPARAVKEIRQKCNNALSRMELGDETIMAELVAALGSGDRYEQLYASTVLLKAGNKKSVRVLKKLLREKDEDLKLSACKLVVEFI